MTPTCRRCGRPTLHDYYAGEGGMGAGLQRAGFCVTPVELDAGRLARFPVDCAAVEPVQADAIEHATEHAHRAAANHASPPCTGYSRGTVALPDRLTRYDRLIAMTREVLAASGRPYIIENVEDAKRELRSPLTVCWTELHRPGSVTDDDGTPLWMRRHRLFESNVTLMGAGGCAHPARMQCAGAYGGARRDKDEARNIRHGGYVPSLRVMRALLGAPWMSEKGCQLSIPPAYGQFIGEQIMEAVA